MRGKRSRTSAWSCFVETFEDGDGVVGFELADALGDGLGFELFENLLADRIVHLGQRRKIEVGAQQFDQARTVIGVEGLQQVAHFRFVEILHKPQQKRLVGPVDRFRCRAEKFRIDFAVLVPEWPLADFILGSARRRQVFDVLHELFLESEYPTAFRIGGSISTMRRKSQRAMGGRGAIISHRQQKRPRKGTLLSRRMISTEVFFKLVRPRGLEPPRVSPLPPQGSASTNSAMAAELEPGTAIPGEAGYTRRIAGPQAHQRERRAVAPVGVADASGFGLRRRVPE